MKENELFDDTIYCENAYTRNLDAVLAKAKSNTNNSFAPWIVLNYLSGFGKTSSVKAWLAHNKLKCIYIDAPLLNVKSVKVECMPDIDLGESGVQIVSGDDLTRIFTPIEKDIDVIFNEKVIDDLDNETVVVIDNYELASEEVRKELYKYIRYHKITDPRVDDSSKTRIINPLMLVVIIDDDNIMLNCHLNEEEIKLLGLDNIAYN